MRQDQTQGSQRHAQLRDIVREWLQAIMDRHGVSQRQLALRAGVSPATINRAMDETGDFVMTTSVMSKISDAFGEPLPAALARPAPGRPAGFSESDLAAYVGPAGPLPARAEPNHGRWRITTRALELEGFRAGDVLDFDLGLKPEPGDVVVAQLYNMQRGTADTVLRVYWPPYLVTRSSDEAIDQRPLYVDDERVKIMGTFVRMVRERPAER
jgi:transcriptional regulator with XRE-family HTH domain